ncbi:5-oxoprolinase subunit PxpB [Neobacillus mesonae]|uniref:5-oxoprolinase subunit PxpB n=1 Tax=Neobacillus mesonae TaxID=1193713 RepID=UPI00203B7646|nr:5-oxoprolinase subunit PxpB [Neobacillus mesonae]MCM3568190.1 5-oxoprolinase subunit PxpB [Neobacillus mesonae]
MFEIKPLGDAAIRVSFSNDISIATHQKIKRFISVLEVEKIKGISEYVPAYNTVAIYYLPYIISYNELAGKLEEVYNTLPPEARYQPIVYEIPVYYGGETGTDLAYIAKYHKLKEEEVIDLHSSQEYLIYMMGFIPGFPYLGGLSEKLSVPRLEHPRLSVAAGSVGIGGKQTGIYPGSVPSGWRILGITPVKLFDIHNTPPSLFTMGNYIKFFPVDKKEFTRIKNLVEKKKYRVKTYIRSCEHD